VALLLNSEDFQQFLVSYHLTGNKVNDMHPHAQHAAEAAEAAAAQDRFWQMHDYLFEQFLKPYKSIDYVGAMEIRRERSNVTLDDLSLLS
jgi:hypothetical protein